MALIETNFIRPQETYDRNTGESKVRYRSYDGNDRFIPVMEGENGVPKTLVEVTHAELKAMRDAGKLTPGALYRITDYNCTTTQENTQSAGHQFDIVLLALSENKLAEEGWAMEHPTDVWTVDFYDGEEHHYYQCYVYETSEGVYNVVDIHTLLGASNVDDYDDINVDNKTMTLQYVYEDSMIEENLTYNYFQNSNLAAWKIWYCLDNDKSRFAWADDSLNGGTPAFLTHNNVNYYRDVLHDSNGSRFPYAWTSSENVTKYTLVLEPQGQVALVNNPDTTRPSAVFVTYTPAHEGTGLPNGRGVIYRLIDEFNNDIKYDFKNIQFKRTITNGQYNANGTNTWCYTLNLWYQDMCQDASIVGNTMPNDKGYVTGVYDNIFGYATAYNLIIAGVDTFALALGDNVVLSLYDESDGYYGICSNTIGSAFYKNTIGSEFRNNMIGNNFTNNIIGSWFDSNTIGNTFVNNTISDNIGFKNYGNHGVELATKDDIGNIETALNNI